MSGELEGDTTFFEDLLAGRGERIVARIGELQE
jgi:hypothetical protein